MRPLPVVLGLSALAATGALSLVVLLGNPATAVPAGHFYTGVYERPQTLNPFTTTGQVARRSVLAFTHDALMDWDPVSGELRPALAARVQAHDDGVTFEFTLRADLRFSDGAPLTMEDVLFTWQVASDPSVPLGSIATGLARVREAAVVPGSPARLRVVLREPYFAGLEAVAPEWTVVSRRHVLGEVARLAAETGATAPQPGEAGFGDLLATLRLPGPGTGAYRLHMAGDPVWPPSRELLLVANPTSWRRAGHPDRWQLDGFRLRFIADADARLTALLKGELDWFGVGDPEVLFGRHPGLRERYRHLRYDYRDLGHFWIVWNTRRTPLDDPRVRRALSMLFDRDAIVRDFLAGNGLPGISYFKPDTENLGARPRYRPEGGPVAFDPDQAGRLLREAGYGPQGEPLRIEILELQESPLYRMVLDLAAPAFERAGVSLARRPVEWSGLQQLRQDRDFDGMIYLQGHGAVVDPYPDFHSSQVDGQNHSGYRDDELDRILDQARSGADDLQRIELFRRADEIIRRDQPVTFLAHPLVSVLVNRDIVGIEPGPLGLHPERWWVPVHRQRRR